MAKVRRVMLVLLLLLLIGTGLFHWFVPDQPTRLVLATNHAKTESVSVQVDHFERTWTQPGRVSKLPPAWLRPYPLLTKAWTNAFRETERVSEGLVWFVVEATVTVPPPLLLEATEYRLDYGSYTLGANHRSIRGGEPLKPYVISTRFEVTDGPVPKALEIRIKDEWLRFPIAEVR